MSITILRAESLPVPLGADLLLLRLTVKKRMAHRKDLLKQKNCQSGGRRIIRITQTERKREKKISSPGC